MAYGLLQRRAGLVSVLGAEGCTSNTPAHQRRLLLPAPAQNLFVKCSMEEKR